MSYAVLHCSSDTNYFRHWSTYEEIAYHDLERTLPVFLVWQIKKDPFDHLLVINGPWWFSQLRIACLCVNLLKMQIPTLTLSSWNKVDLMYAFHATWLLPDYQVMFIGMKKKLWNVHIPSKQYELIDVSDEQKEAANSWTTGSIDMVEDHLLIQGNPVLRDDMILYGICDEGMKLTYHWQTDCIAREKLFATEHLVDYLIPEYMIAPSIG